MRIIGGRWRGTRIALGDVPGLRPTPDRVRETLFNWLAEHLPGARCLDLFAGTGVLGFEALSRGAAAVTLVDRDEAAVRALRALAERLQAGDAEVRRADALTHLSGPAERMDLVFVDPPYDADVLGEVLERLADGWVDAGTYVYVEQPVARPLDPGTAWETLREGRTRHVHYALLRPCDGA